MIRRIALSALWAATLLPASLRAEDEMEARWFPLANEHFDQGEAPAGSASTEGADARRIAYLKELGIQFPAGSYVRVPHGTGRLVMFNTAPNRKRLAQLLAKALTQVEIDVAFVDFSPGDIAKAAREQDGAVPTTDQLKELWHAGQGQLLAATKTVTRSGVNAQVKGVEEIIYPTEFLSDGGGSNALKRLTLVPTSFETRETGAIVNVTPTVGDDGRTIDLTLVPEFCTEGDASNVTIARHDRKNGDLSLVVQQPRFHSRNVTTSVVLRDGATVVLGGLPNRDGDQWCYLFITARLLDAQAAPAADFEGYPMDEE